MAEAGVVQENSGLFPANDNNDNTSANALDVNSEPTASVSSENSQRSTDECQTSNQIQTDSYVVDNSIQSQNRSDDGVHSAMSRLSMHETRLSSRFHRNAHHSSHYAHPRHSYHRHPIPQQSAYYVNEEEAHAQLAAFTPSLMSLSISPQDQSNQSSSSSRSFSQPATQSIQSQSPLLTKIKTESIHQPEYYVDSFAPTFANKPVSNENNNNKTKSKHVTFQEPEMSDEPKRDEHHLFSPPPLPPSNGFDYSTPPMYHYRPPPPVNRFSQNTRFYNYNQSYHYLSRPRYSNRSRGMNMMSMHPAGISYYDQQMMPYYQQPIYFPQHRQLYDPNKPKVSVISESTDTSANVIRNIVPKNKKKTKRMTESENMTETIPEPVQPPITILRKPTNDEIVSPIIPPPVEDRPVSTEPCPSTSISIPSHEILSILQSANCLSSFNEYVQQKKFTLKYDFSPVSSSSFSCSISLDGRQFAPSISFASKTEAQKFACDQVLRILYREACDREQSSIEFQSKHDLIAHRAVSTFHDLNANEFLLGRKTLACILMTTDGHIDQARVISIGTGNSCLAESNFLCTNDGSILHDCHAEILARRGLIRFFLEQLKQIKQEKNSSSSIFEFNSITNKYRLRSNIAFHMYISSLPCGMASTNIPSNSIRYKQNHAEGTLLASSTNSSLYPIKSCTDKICRWNILGIQGGLLISLLDTPIYLQTLTFACETTTFDRDRIRFLFSQRLHRNNISLSLPYIFNVPDIDCPQTKFFQQERQVARLQTNAFAWNITENNRMELLEPMTGRLKTDRSVSSLSKQRLFEDFIQLIETNNNSLTFSTYQQAKQLDQNYVQVKKLISAAFEAESPGISVPWSSKSDRLEQFVVSSKQG